MVLAVRRAGISCANSGTRGDIIVTDKIYGLWSISSQTSMISFTMTAGAQLPQQYFVSEIEITARRTGALMWRSSSQNHNVILLHLKLVRESEVTLICVCGNNLS